MSQSNKKQRRVQSKEDVVEKRQKRNNIILAVLMLVLMVFGTAGWAMMSAGTSGTSSTTSKPKDYPLSQQQLTNGSYVWYAIKNYQEFFFNSISQFQDDTASQMLANQIKNKSVVSIYDQNGTYLEESYLLQTALKGVDVGYSLASTQDCSNPNQVVFTNQTLEGNCIQIVFDTNQTPYEKTQAIVYYMIK